MAESHKKQTNDLKQSSDLSLNESEQPNIHNVEVSCSDTFTEWRRCISAFHQFHQYYVYGELSHCKEEKNRMYNCLKWKGLRKDSAGVALVESLALEQRNMHSPNPPWKLRKSPPSDWKD